MLRMPLDLVLTVLVLCGALIAVQLVILTFELVRMRRDMLRAIAFFAAAASGNGWRGRPIEDEWGEWGDEEPTAPTRRPARVMPAVAVEGRLSPFWVRLRAFWRRLLSTLLG
jgi:hypothetical protein